MKSRPSSNQYNPFRNFFGDEFFYSPNGQHPRVASGSGVIISSDGYVVTNNHVVESGNEIELTLSNNRTYKAELIGTDKHTDIALLKIDGQNFDYITFGNSDEVRVGEWVLAVGNPFNLASTVTAGIVSAKARNINILKGNFKIESFIQTDAAVNPGNSGGALVSIDGRLIGINTAIATPTGTYAGYSFAVPVNMVQKVVNDLIDFGVVQRGFLGVSIRNIDNDMAEDLNLKSLEGIYIEEIAENSAAQNAGLEKGDILIAIGDKKVSSVPELQEMVSRYRPGVTIDVTYIRKGKTREIKVKLMNKDGNIDLVTRDLPDLNTILGADLRELSSEEKGKYSLDGGVMVSGLRKGKLRSSTDIKEGFIITKIDNKKIKNLSDLKTALLDKEGGVMLEGTYPDYPGVYYYAFGM